MCPTARGCWAARVPRRMGAGSAVTSYLGSTSPTTRRRRPRSGIASLAERGFSPQDYLPYDHHRWRLVIEVADLSDADRLAAVGLDLPRPSRRTWPAFQTRRRTALARGLGWPDRSKCRPARLAGRLRVHQLLATPWLPTRRRPHRRGGTATTPRHDYLNSPVVCAALTSATVPLHLDALRSRVQSASCSRMRFGH